MFDKLKKLQYGLKVKWYEATRDRARMIDLDGRKVQMMEGGEGEALLYLHSAYGENIWLPFHQKLSEHFHIIAPAHPGFAQSEGLEDIDSMEDMVFHYIDLLDHLGYNRINVAGVSLGGWIAAELATRYPERVKKIVLGAPAGLWHMDHPMTDLFALMRRPSRMREALFHNADSGLAQMFVPAEPAEDMMVEAFKAMAATARLAWNPPGHNPKLAGRLRRIKSPVLILWGDDDKLIPTPLAREWERHLPNARVEIIPSCGHMLMFECEDEFVNSVSRFLA
jgi:pimeloyl-ACP methyl ester carboxylesterase